MLKSDIDPEVKFNCSICMICELVVLVTSNKTSLAETVVGN